MHQLPRTEKGHISTTHWKVCSYKEHFGSKFFKKVINIQLFLANTLYGIKWNLRSRYTALKNLWVIRVPLSRPIYRLNKNFTILLKLKKVFAADYQGYGWCWWVGNPSLQSLLLFGVNKKKLPNRWVRC